MSDDVREIAASENEVHSDDMAATATPPVERLSPVVNAAAYYLDRTNESDRSALTALASDKRFFFAPFNNALRDGYDPRTAAGMMFGRHRAGDVVVAVRRKIDNDFVGLIRFTDVKRVHADRPAFQVELSYLFHPNYQGMGYGRSSVLQALDWYIGAHELERKRGATICATFDPGIGDRVRGNDPSYQILSRAGLKVSGYIPDSGYAGRGGQERSRIYMEASVKSSILPALEEARGLGVYEPVEASIAATLPIAAIPSTGRRLGHRRVRYGVHGSDLTEERSSRVVAGGGLLEEYCHHEPVRSYVPFSRALGAFGR